MTKRFYSARGRSLGQSLVEFALVLPIIVVLVLGIVDLGRGIFAYNTLAESARQANRLAIVDQNITSIKNVAVAHAPALGLAASDIDVCFKETDSSERDCGSGADECGSNSARRIACLAIVTSSTTFTPITPIISGLIPSIVLASTSIGPIEHVCPSQTRPNCQ